MILSVELRVPAKELSAIGHINDSTAKQLPSKIISPSQSTPLPGPHVPSTSVPCNPLVPPLVRIEKLITPSAAISVMSAAGIRISNGKMTSHLSFSGSPVTSDC